MLARCTNLAALFALYPRFYFIKSVYVNNEYRFLASQLCFATQAAYCACHPIGSLKRCCIALLYFAISASTV